MATTTTTTATDRWLLAGALALALAVRLVAFNGAFGSDDVTYFVRALDVASGQWSNAHYNGALRYGFNLPAGALMVLFGSSDFAANLWPLLCALAEVALVAWFCHVAAGPRAAWMAALLLATAPLQISVATRIHADPVVAAALTASYVLLFTGLRQQRRGLLLAAGLALGGVFWAKELAAVVYFALLPMLWLFRGRWHLLLWALGGLLAMLLLHGVLMQAIAGNPLHLVHTVMGQLSRNFIHGGQSEDAAGYYLRYLFVDLRHVGLLGFGAVAGVWLAVRSRSGDSGRNAGVPDGAKYAAVWLLGLLLVLSLFPVSLSPLKLTMKQSNYISLFMAPLAVLSALALARLAPRRGALLVGAAAVLGSLLALLQQADYRAFTANSRALAAWAAGQPNAVIVATTNNAALGAHLLREPPGSRHRVLSYREVGNQPALLRARMAAGHGLYAVIDPQTVGWFAGRFAQPQPLACWTPVTTLAPQGMALGNRLAGVLALGLTPVSEPMAGALRRLAEPAPATVYRVAAGADLWCGGRPGP